MSAPSRALNPPDNPSGSYHLVLCCELHCARMGETPQAVRTFDIAGQEVRCYQSEGHPLWRCECPAFQRRLSRFGEGFCAHTAVAIMRSTEDGSIEL